MAMFMISKVMANKNTFNRLKRREREVRKNLIVDAAQKVFGSRTYDKVSMAEIAAEAGIAKSSIYTYFSSQEDLFVEAAIRDTSQFIAEMQTVLDSRPDHIIDTFVHRFIGYYSRNEAHWRMITHFSLYGNIGSSSAHKLNQTAQGFMDILDQVILAAGYGGPPRLLSHTLFASVSGILIAFRKYPGRSEAEKAAHMKRIGTIVTEMFRAYIHMQKR